MLRRDLPPDAEFDAGQRKNAFLNWHRAGHYRKTIPERRFRCFGGKHA